VIHAALLETCVPLLVSLSPSPQALDHSQDNGGKKHERCDRHDDGQFGCKFHRKLSFPIGGGARPATERLYWLLSVSAKPIP
jgi:hypothetical protein